LNNGFEIRQARNIIPTCVLPSSICSLQEGNASAAGKVFLAHGVAGIPARLERLTERTIVDPAALERELQAVRARGYATLVDELEPGLSVVAAPVYDAGGGVVAALAVSGPTSRLPGHRLATVGRVAIEQAHAVSARLGYGGGARGRALTSADRRRSRRLTARTDD